MAGRKRVPAMTFPLELNTSVTHITELEEAIKAAINCLNSHDCGLFSAQLHHAAESFGLDLSDPKDDEDDEDDPFGTGDI